MTKVLLNDEIVSMAAIWAEQWLLVLCWRPINACVDNSSAGRVYTVPPGVSDKFEGNGIQ